MIDIENKYLIGDNIDLLKQIDDKTVTLCYLDPPFNTGRNFDDFNDKWKNADEYLDFLKLRLIEIHRILKNDGNIVVHVDAKIAYKIRIILDEIFNEKNYQNEIVWKTTGNKKSLKKLARSYDILIVYSKTAKNRNSFAAKKNIYNPLYKPYDDKYMEQNNVKMCEIHKKYYVTTAAHNSQPNVNPRLNLRYEWNGHFEQWYLEKEKIQQMDANNRLEYNKQGIPRIKRFLDEMKGIPIRDVWDDISSIQGGEKLDYATQKPIKLLERVINIYSNEGDLVLDPFAGSGTTGRACIKLNRKYLLMDKNEKGRRVWEGS